MNSLFIDISSFQPTNINWPVYAKWSRESGDGKSRLCVKSSYGNGFFDPKYHEFIQGAIAGGVDIIYHYHYAYPQYNAPEAEADWHHYAVGPLKDRPSDLVMLDFEESQAWQSTPDWAYRFLARQKQNYAGRLPLFYSFDDFIRTSLQDDRLSQFPLVLANWKFDPSARPPAPPPWKHYEFIQWTDKDTSVPGLPAGTVVDADVYTVAGTDYHNAIPMWLPDTLSFSTNSDKFVVIHETAGEATLQKTFDVLKNKGVSVNYAVDGDGKVAQFVRESRGAFGNCCLEPGHLAILPDGNPNTYTISIEHTQPDTTNTAPLSPAQIAASFKLVNDICIRHGIPADHIIGHRDIEPVSKPDCPGTYPMDALREFVASGGTMIVPARWTDDGKVLTAYNGVRVILGFREFILGRQWDSDNLPLDKQRNGVVLLHRPDLGNMDFQIFTKDVLWYTPVKGIVRETQLGLEIDLRNKVIADMSDKLDSANAQIALLEAQLAAGNSVSPELQAAINSADAQLGVLKSQLDPFVKE